MKNLERIPIYKRIVLIVWSFVLIFVISFLFIQIYVDTYSARFIYNDKAKLPKCEAVLVLGASVYKDKTPSPILEERLMNAYEIYSEGYAKKIIVSGDHRSDDYDEVTTMKNFLTEKGIKDGDILMDHAGLDTYQSIYTAKTIFKVNSLIISTQDFHVKRALYISRKLGIKAYGYPCKNKTYNNIKSLNFRESLAKVKAVLGTDFFIFFKRY